MQAISYVIYTFMVALAVEGSGIMSAAEIIDVSSAGSTIVTGIIMAIANHVYFKKRAHLFVN